jgi:hypothetical protein
VCVRVILHTGDAGLRDTTTTATPSRRHPRFPMELGRMGRVDVPHTVGPAHAC